MSKAMALAIKRREQLRYSAQTPRHNAWRNLPAGFGLLSVAAILFLGYFVLVNDLSTKGYELESLTREKNKLEAQAKELAVNSARLQSLQSLTERVNQLSYQRIDKIEYIKNNDSVAMNH